MDPRQFFFAVVELDEDDKPERLRGNAFVVTDDGGLVTCRHVVDAPEGTPLAIVDLHTGHAIRVTDIVFPTADSLDLAFLPAALRRPSRPLPLLSPGALLVGEDVHTYGWYSQSGRAESRQDGYFKGNVVAFRAVPQTVVTLSYPVIEGLSGSPVLTPHNGAKVVGACFGSESQRVLAQEIVEMTKGETRYVETVNRVVEFGLAYRSEVLETFLAEVGGRPVVTSDSYDLG